MEQRGIVPLVGSFNAVISALGSMGRWKDAIAMLRRMTDGDAGVLPTTGSFNATISACAVGGQSDTAMALLEEMKRRDLHVNAVSGGGGKVATRPPTA